MYNCKPKTHTTRKNEEVTLNERTTQNINKNIVSKNEQIKYINYTSYTKPKYRTNEHKLKSF